MIDYTTSYMGDTLHIPPPLHELEAEVMDEFWSITRPPSAMSWRR